jgi:hypothetical protein
MPLYEYRCGAGHYVEDLRSYSARLDPFVCHCGRGSTITVSLPARMSYSWGDTRWDGFYDRALGVTYRDRAHREQVMRERGLRNLEDGEVEAEQRRLSAEADTHDENMKTYQRVLDDTGSNAIAMKQTFPDAGVCDV